MEKLTEAQEKYKKKIDLLSALIKSEAITLQDALMLLEKDEVPEKKPYIGIKQSFPTLYDYNILPCQTPFVDPINTIITCTTDSSGITYVPTSGATTTAFGTINYPANNKSEKQETI